MLYFFVCMGECACDRWYRWIREYTWLLWKMKFEVATIFRFLHIWAAAVDRCGNDSGRGGKRGDAKGTRPHPYNEWSIRTCNPINAHTGQINARQDGVAVMVVMVLWSINGNLECDSQRVMQRECDGLSNRWQEQWWWCSQRMEGEIRAYKQRKARVYVLHTLYDWWL